MEVPVPVMVRVEKAERDYPSTTRPVDRDVPSVNVLVEEIYSWIIKIESRLPESDELF